MAVEVIYPGAFTTIQDRGRYGYQALGVPVSGPMDPDAYRAADLLVGNDPGTAQLEMTLLGGIFRFDAPATVALCGADMSPMLNQVPVPMWKAFDVSPKDTLALGCAKTGCRCYLAVRGGFDVPLVMGSRSTSVRCHLGGIEGRTLRAGDRLEICEGPKVSAGSHLEFCEEQEIHSDVCSGRKDPATESADVRAAEYASSVTVRVMAGPQDDMFTEHGLQTFFSSAYVMEEGSDRMGIRFQGEKIESVSGTDILSDGTVFGSVQITSSGLPIVLMADHQTTGGYAKIATVLSSDLWKLAQLRPGQTVRFERAD